MTEPRGTENEASTAEDEAPNGGREAGPEPSDARQGERAGDEWECGPKGRGREMPFADNIHGLVDDILEGVRNFTPVASVRYPRYDFVETPDAYLLVFDLPGLERSGISVTTEGEDLVVSGERPGPDWGEGSTIRRNERPYGGFRRTLRMPADVRVEGIKARLEDGILTVTLPRETEGGARKVDIEG